MSHLRLVAFVVLALGALGVRTWDLPRRPMHADEANQALKAGVLLETGDYAFDPRDHHGPTLYYAALPVAWLRGERSVAELTETTVRLVPALAGTLAVLVLALAGPRETPGSRWLAAALLALSPPAVYYARFFIQETLLLACTLLTFACAQRWWTTARIAWALAAGAAAGLMLATKESAGLLLAALGVAAMAARPARPAAAQWGRHTLVAAGAAVLVAACFYSSWGQHPAGLRDALLAPWLGLDRAVGPTGHEKPWWYYLQLLTVARSGGLVWEQAGLTALALLGVGFAFVQRSPWLRGAAVYALIVLLALSVVPYKTPWNLLHVLPPLCVLAAGAITALAQRRRGALLAAIGIAVLVVSSALHTRRAVFVRSADFRNPWAYVHSSPDVRKVRPLVETALTTHPGGVARVIGPEYWPLPWYLRGLTRVGYWNSPPDDCDGAILIVAAEQAELVRSRVRGAYRESILGLRPGVLVVVFVRDP